MILEPFTSRLKSILGSKRTTVVIPSRRTARLTRERGHCEDATRSQHPIGSKQGSQALAESVRLHPRELGRGRALSLPNNKSLRSYRLGLYQVNERRREAHVR